jgi:hypothetical protein
MATKEGTGNFDLQAKDTRKNTNHKQPLQTAKNLIPSF